MIRICFSTGSGWNWPCFRISTIRWPRVNCACEALSRSEPNCAKAASARYCARSRRSDTGDLAHGFDLRVAADAADRDTDVDRGTDVGVEQVGFQVDLAVGDRDHVGRNVRRNVAGLRFDERQRGQRPAAELVVELRGALQQAAVEIEHVAGKSFAAGRTAQQQRDLAIGRGVLRKIVVDAERVTAACRGSIRPWRSRNTARCTASEPDRTPWRRRRWCIPSRRSPRAS